MNSIKITPAPDATARRKALDTAVRRLTGHWDSLPDRSIGPDLPRDQICRRVREFDFSAPVALDALVETVSDLLQSGIVHVAHPAYFGLFNPTPTLAGVLGELLAAGFNPQLAVHSHAPAAVEIENHVITALGAKFGFPAESVSGHFTSGGSEANMTAALAALTRSFPDYAEQGLASLRSRPLLYVSRESHFAWFKIAHQLGLGRQAVRLVATNGRGQMDADALETLIKKDKRAGGDPFFIAATAGTTNAGMIDPLHATADVARNHGAWLHVDAAWAGALIVSDRLRSALDGIERADSITVDAHKWFSVPMGAGMYIGQQRQALAQAFRVSASYMPSQEVSEDPYLLSAQWSRRAIGLKFFMSLASLGWEGYSAIVERQVELAAVLSRSLHRQGYRILNDSPAAVICFVPTDGRKPAEIVERIHRNRRCWISLAQFEGTNVLRATVTSYRTTEREVDLLLSELAA